jgi:hypothetical protein
MDLFGSLKQHLGANWLHINKEVEMAVSAGLKMQEPVFMAS